MLALNLDTKTGKCWSRFVLVMKAMMTILKFRKDVMIAGVGKGIFIIRDVMRNVVRGVKDKQYRVRARWKMMMGWIMGKRKPLTAKEKFIAKKIGADFTLRYENMERKKIPNVPSVVRAKLSRRKDHRLYSDWEELVNEVLGKKIENLDDFKRLSYKLQYLEKYQGYIVGQYVEAEWLANKMTDEEIERWLVLEEV